MDTKRDAIVVLGGRIEDNGEPADKTKRRVEVAVSLHNRQLAPVIVMSGFGAHDRVGAAPTTEASGMADYAIKLGVPAGKIILEEESKDTFGNAYFVKRKVLEPNGWHNIYVVTSDIHATRAKYLFEKILGQGYEVEFVPAQINLIADERVRKEQVEAESLEFAKKYIAEREPLTDSRLDKIIKYEHPVYTKP